MHMANPIRTASRGITLSRRAAHAAAGSAGLGLLLCAGFPGVGWTSVPGNSFTIRLEQMRHPDARITGEPDGNSAETVETGTHPLLGALDWGGRRFLHYGHRTYWTADGGLSWRSQDWMDTGVKPPRPLLPQARFRTTGTELYLMSGEGAAAVAAFDSAREEWRRTDFGHVGKNAFTAVGCDAGSVYLYDVAQELSRSRDGGSTWQRIAKVPPPEGGSFYEDIEAEGSRLLLRFNRPYAIATNAASADGGATWRRFPAGVDAHLFEGCFHFAAEGSLRSECGPEAADRITPAPFGRLDRLFRQEGGELFALADAGLFHFRPAEPGKPGEDPAGGVGAGGSWEPVEGFGAEQGWLVSRAAVSRQTSATVTWLPVAAPATVSVRPVRGSGMPIRPGSRLLPGLWLEKGRGLDGRALRTPAR